MKWKKPPLQMITFLIIFKIQLQKQESRKMSNTNLTGLIRKNLRGGTLSLFSLYRDNTCLKEDNSKSLTKGPRIFLTKCYRNI